MAGSVDNHRNYLCIQFEAGNNWYFIQISLKEAGGDKCWEWSHLIPGSQLGGEDGLRYSGVMHVGLGRSSPQVGAGLSPGLVLLLLLLLHLPGHHGREADVAPVSVTAGGHCLFSSLLWLVISERGWDCFLLLQNPSVCSWRGQY